MKKWLFLSVWLFLVMTSRSYAVLFQEIGDAGKTLDTAILVAEGTTQINGYLEFPDAFNNLAGADLFTFWWGGGSFEAVTSGQGDFQLFLFDQYGRGLWSNDDISQLNLNARISDPDLAPGIYYLGISSYDYDPYNIFDEEIFSDGPYDAQLAPQATEDYLAYWDGAAWEGDIYYTISFSSPANVPEPATIVLLGLALGILGFLSQKIKKYKEGENV
ncbi:DVUA0089 family protein [Thermodesulfatator autotrophicus]|uniref:Ice-binding protein C-terminal domain-containing protein n=1 Tax=Thermodesulfatator autotrophicus TaxID=1795632 RepID=A0A177E6H0_9BACT|nr:DVUA0089 family protein [Thermodesulfatator autotrophicus]OAG26812.1 hypothetical protein TH606_10250 [Thermodesulfatator autotrophicus]